MADNVAITAGSGTTIAADELTDGTLGSVKVQYVKLMDGTLDGSSKAAVNVNGLAVVTAFNVVAGSTVTRPANTTAYTALDAVSNNATAGSVTAISFTATDGNDLPICLERCRIDSTDTGVANTVFRIYFYQSDPTASTGIVGGDNSAFSTKKGTFIGSMIGTFKAFTDGSIACCTPEDGSHIISNPTSGAQTIYALLQTVSGFTPSANSTTFICTIEAFQGRT